MAKKSKPDMLKTSLAELLAQHPSTEAEKDAYIQALQSCLKDTAAEVDELKEAVLWMKKQMFGSKSEKRPEPEQQQLGMFNEAEQEYKELAEEPAKKDKRGWHIRDTKGRWKLAPTKNIEFVQRVLSIPESELYCPECGEKFICIGKEIVREVPEFIPAKVRIIQYVQPRYCCPVCKKKGAFAIYSVPAPKPLLNHSMASASVVAEVMYQKYVLSVPLTRQEKEWAEAGLCFTSTTMANWVIRCSQDWLSLVYDRLKLALRQRQVLHADETPVQVLKENGKTAQSKSYMWVYRSGKDEQPPILLYEYQPGRSGDYPKAFLEGFTGYLHTDGYAGYNKVKGITRCGCWAHVRRKFLEAKPPEGMEGAAGSAETALNFIDRLFKLEEKAAKLSPEKRQKLRLAEEEPILRAYWCWLENLDERPLGGKLKTAVEYSLKQRPYLENYLHDSRCQLSNNWAENAVRPFVVGRKNWMFSTSVEGAKASAVVYSLVETAKANNLNPRDYLKILLENLPAMEIHQNPASADQLLPWSDFIQSQFCAKE